MHEVLRVIDERVRSGSRPGNRSDGLRVVLSIEGGGMRGVVCAGMALALHELGQTLAFDAVYGASAGAITGAWLLCSDPERLRGWTDPDYVRTLIRWPALLRLRPVVDVRSLVELVYQSQFPMEFASMLASPVEYHPLATDAATGTSTDLRPLIGGPAELRLALCASASIPFLAGPPVRLRGRRFYDAGVAEPVPFRTPVAQGATHILVLRSRQPSPAGSGTACELPVTGSHAPRPSRSIRFLTWTALRNESPQLRTAVVTRSRRTAADVARILELQVAGNALMIYPPESAPPVTRLTTDGPLLVAAFESGRAAIHAMSGAGQFARRGPGGAGEPAGAGPQARAQPRPGGCLTW